MPSVDRFRCALEIARGLAWRRGLWRKMSVREQKLESRIKRLVGDILLRGLADPRIDGLISVTQVRVTPDLRQARVFVSVFAAPAATVMEGLAAAQRHVQRQVARGLSLRVAPQLSFHLDESLKRQGRMLALLAGRQPPPDPPVVDDGPTEALPPAGSTLGSIPEGKETEP